MKMEDISNQAEKTDKWLKERHPEVFADQTHLDEGTQERAYWHYGRLLALRDVIRALSH